MLIVNNNKRFVKKHIVGGAGIVDTLSSLFRRLTTSGAARALAAAATTDIGKAAVSGAKTVGTELAKSAVSSAKDVLIKKGKQLIDRTSTKILTPKSVDIIKSLTGLEPNPPVITQKSKDILSSLVNTGATTATTNINKLMLGQGMKAIKIQDLVRQTNGAGLRLAN